MKYEKNYNYFKNLIVKDAHRFNVQNVLIANIYMNMCDRKMLDNINESLLDQCESINLCISVFSINILQNSLSSLTKEELIDLFYETINEVNYTNYGSSKLDMCNLVYYLLDLKNGDTLCDFGSGKGAFLANTIRLCKHNNLDIELYGVEIEEKLAILSSISMNIILDNYPNDMLWNDHIMSFDSIEYNKAYAFLSKNSKYTISKDINSLLFKDIVIKNRNNNEWLNIDKILYNLKGDNKKAVAIVSSSALSSSVDLEYRKALIKSKLIESIIELPDNTLDGTQARPYLMVFSNNNDGIKFCDASNIKEAKCSRKRRRFFNVLDVFEELENNSNYKTIEELENIDSLIPSVINIDVKNYKKSARLEEVADVFLGSQYTLSKFSEKGLVTIKKTGYKIITNADIDGGLIGWNNLYNVDFTDSKNDRFAVKMGDLVIANKSSKIKIAIVDKEPTDKVIVTGGMIIVRPDQSKLNSTYLKMFLESENGQIALKKIQKGDIIISISAKDLGTIEVPLIDIDIQEEKADEHNKLLSSIVRHKKQIKELESKLHELVNKLDID